VRVQVIDSPYRCRRCSKRMVQQAGQHDSDGDLEVLHECWSCGYSFTQRPERDRPSEAGKTFAEMVRDKVRAGQMSKPMPPPAAFEPYVEDEAAKP